MSLWTIWSPGSVGLFKKTDLPTKVTPARVTVVHQYGTWSGEKTTVFLASVFWQVFTPAPAEILMVAQKVPEQDVVVDRKFTPTTEAFYLITRCTPKSRLGSNNLSLANFKKNSFSNL